MALRVSWIQNNLELRTNFLAFEYEVRIVHIIPSHIDPDDPTTEHSRVIVPGLKVEIIHVPLDCD